APGDREEARAPERARADRRSPRPLPPRARRRKRGRRGPLRVAGDGAPSLPGAPREGSAAPPRRDVPRLDGGDPRKPRPPSAPPPRRAVAGRGGGHPRKPRRRPPRGGDRPPHPGGGVSLPRGERPASGTLLLAAIAVASALAPWLAPSPPDAQEDVAGARLL